MTTFLLALLLASVALWLPPGGRLSSGPECDSFSGPVPRGLANGLLALTMALACFAPLLSYQPYTEKPADPAVPFWALFTGHGLLTLFLFGWWWLAGRPQWRDFLHFGRGRWVESFRQGLLAGLGIWVLAIFTMAVAALVAGASDSPGPGEAGDVPPVIRMIVEFSWYQRLLLVISAGVVEEAFFRSFLQTRRGLVWSSLAFVMSHMGYGLPLMLVGIFAVSIAFGVLFRAQDDVRPAMVAHAVFDAIQLFVVLPVVVSGG